MRPLQAVPADVVWPALFLEKRLLSIWVISIGLVVEWLVLWLGGFGLSWKRAVVVDLVMNAASTIVGIVLILLAGLAWELFAHVLLYGDWLLDPAITFRAGKQIILGPLPSPVLA